MKRRELFWMLVPCLLLAGAGVYFSRYPLPSSKGPTFEIIEAKRVPVTPRDVFEGFDKKVVVVVKRKNVYQKKIYWFYPNRSYKDLVSLVGTRNGKRVAIPEMKPANAVLQFQHETLHMQGDNMASALVYRMKLREIPQKWGALELKFTCNAKTTVVQDSAIIQSEAAKALTTRTISLPVREADQVIRLPEIDRSQPFAFKDYSVTSWWETNRIQYSLMFLLDKIDLKRVDTTEIGLFPFVNGELIVDGKSAGGIIGASMNYDEKTRILRLTPGVLTVSDKARNVVFKSGLSLNNCWPLPISIALRKDGKNITHVKPKFD